MTAVAGETGRRVVLMFTDGKDLPVDEGPDVTFDQVRQRVEAEDVMVYAIGLSRECPTEPLFIVPAPAAASVVAYQRPGQRGGGVGGRGGMGRGGGPVRVGPRTGGRGRGGGPIPFPMPPRVPNTPGYPPARPPVIFDPLKSKELVSGCSPSRPDPHLRAITSVGGGGYFELTGTADLNTTFARVADELHRQYLLAYVAPEHDGALHHLEVRVHRPDVSVRARSGYIAPK
jgi:VWFA-related protein